MEVVIASAPWFSAAATSFCVLIKPPVMKGSLQPAERSLMTLGITPGRISTASALQAVSCVRILFWEMASNTKKRWMQ